MRRLAYRMNTSGLSTSESVQPVGKLRTLDAMRAVAPLVGIVDAQLRERLLVDHRLRVVRLIHHDCGCPIEPGIIASRQRRFVIGRLAIVLRRRQVHGV